MLRTHTERHNRIGRTASVVYLHELADEAAADGLSKSNSASRAVTLVCNELADVAHAAQALDSPRNETHAPVQPVELRFLCAARHMVVVVTALRLPLPSPDVARKCSTCKQNATARAAASYGSSQCRPQQGRRSYVEVCNRAHDEEGRGQAVGAAAGACSDTDETAGARLVCRGGRGGNARTGVHERGG